MNPGMEDRDSQDHDDDRVPGLDRLTLDREPAHDLWSGIESRLHPARAVMRRRSRTWRPLAAAASVSAVLAGLLSLQLMHTSQPVVVPAGAALTSPALAYADEVAGLDAGRAHSLRKENRALVKGNLKLVMSAEQQLQQALLSDPESSYLQSLLQTTDTQQRHLRGLLAHTRS